MRKFHRMAVRALGLCSGGGLVMCATLPAPCFRVSAFWVWHELQLLFLRFQFQLLCSLRNFSQRLSISDSEQPHVRSFKFVPHTGHSPLHESLHSNLSGTDSKTVCRTSSAISIMLNPGGSICTSAGSRCLVSIPSLTYTIEYADESGCENIVTQRSHEKCPVAVMDAVRRIWVEDLSRTASTVTSPSKSSPSVNSAELTANSYRWIPSESPPIWIFTVFSLRYASKF